MKSKIIHLMKNKKIITIMRGISGDKAIKSANAIVNGGLKFLEVTFDPSGIRSDEETAELINRINKEFKDDLYIGAGTVITAKQVEMAKQAGAVYIISPDTDCEIIKRTCELGMVSIPGALTPTEIKQGFNAGADFEKIFPAASLGAAYIKAVKASLNHINFMAVGGVNLDNIEEFAKAGVCGFGIGENILKTDYINHGEFDKITAIAKQYNEKVML